MGESLETARCELEKALREPGHSPTEDALLSAIAALLDEIEAIEKHLENPRG
jgi:hypothetical protein